MVTENEMEREEKERSSDSFFWRLLQKGNKKNADPSEKIEDQVAQEEESAPQDSGDSDRMPHIGNYLEMLRRWKDGSPVPAPPVVNVALDDKEAGAEEENQRPPVLYSSFMFDGQEPPEEMKRYIDKMQLSAKKLLEEIERQEKAYQEQLAKNEKAREQAELAGEELGEQIAPSYKPVDSVCNLFLTRDSMMAMLFLLPPAFEGAAPDEEQLYGLLASQKVTNGVEEAVLKGIAAQPTYFKFIVVAKGQAPVDGIDGQIIDLIPREHKITYGVGADGSVNYKELNWLHKVTVGDKICEIIPRVEAIPGFTVQGRKLDGKPGKQPQVPMGKNTALNEEGTALVSTAEGQVTFIERRFQVIQVITIPGNVDGGVGNLDVVGDLFVEGDILDGFQVKASGNVVVRGMIEGASLTVGGNLQICNGMNGNNRGTIKVGGDIFSKFLENCIIECGGSIHSDSLINCTTTCDDTVDITSGRGVIIGGSLLACNSVQAKVIGNKSFRVNNITIGNTTSFLREKKQAAGDVKQLGQELDELQKNLTYIDRAKELTPEIQAVRNQIKLRLTVVRLQHSKAVKRLETMESQSRDLSRCTVVAGEIYPLTQVAIGSDALTISTLTRQCRIFRGRDGITIGLK